MSIAVFIKDPSDVLDYGFDFAAWLNGDTITGTPVWTIPAGLTKNSQNNTTTAATVWLSGGAHGNDHLITVQITTGGGRTKQRSLKIMVREQ